jgi:hypothetical protein
MNKHDRHRKKREARKQRRESRFIQSRARAEVPKLTIERDEGVSRVLVEAASRARQLYYNKRLPGFFGIWYSLAVEHRYQGEEGFEGMTQGDWEDFAADFIRDFVAGALAEVAIGCGHYHCCEQGVASWLGPREVVIRLSSLTPPMAVKGRTTRVYCPRHCARAGKKYPIGYTPHFLDRYHERAAGSGQERQYAGWHDVIGAIHFPGVLMGMTPTLINDRKQYVLTISHLDQSLTIGNAPYETGETEFGPIDVFKTFLTTAMAERPWTDGRTVPQTLFREFKFTEEANELRGWFIREITGAK